MKPVESIKPVEPDETRKIICMESSVNKRNEKSKSDKHIPSSVKSVIGSSKAKKPDHKNHLKSAGMLLLKAVEDARKSTKHDSDVVKQVNVIKPPVTSTSKRKILPQEVYVEEEQSSPKFIITFKDGDRNLSSSNSMEKPSAKSRLGNRVLPNDDLRTKLSLSERLGKLDNFPQSESMEDTNDSKDNKKMHLPEHLERCIYWPNCKNADTCPYIHPTEPCKLFPHCGSLAKSCVFIHPECKYDGQCARNDCAYLHTKPNMAIMKSILPQPAMIPMMSGQIPCKFHPHCANTSCPYYHPAKIIPMAKSLVGTPCRYGPSCRNQPKCPYAHKPQPSAPSKLKWVNPKFSAGESDPAVTEKTAVAT